MNTQKKNTHLLRNLIILLIILLAVAALVLFVFIPIYSQEETTFGEDPVVHAYDGDGKAIVLENDRHGAERRADAGGRTRCEIHRGRLELRLRQAQPPREPTLNRHPALVVIHF